MFRSFHNRPGWLACASLLLIAAAALLTAPVAAHAAGMLIADGGLGGNLEIKEHQVHVTINNGVAVTEVEQVFVNTENRVVEALYTFPVPQAASVSNFSMWINGKEMTGEVLEKERARQIYNQYKAVKRDPGLLEQIDYKRFEMRIFPIPARAEQRVKVTYYQELNFDHDWATYVYPLATVTRADQNQRVRGRFAMTLDSRSEVPILEMKSPSHGDEFAVVQHGSPNYWQASLEARDGNLNRDVVVAYHLERPHTGIDVITSRQRGEDGYLQLTLTAGKELEEKNTGADFVFVLDVSGSMAFDGKLGVSRRSLEEFIDALGEQDRFEIIAFNISPTAMFNQLTDVKADTKRSASEFLSSQKARGGTVLRPAIEMAYRYRQNDRPLNVVVLSDGMTEQQEQRELIAAVNQRPSNATVFCIGVGNEVNRPLLTQMARDAGGLSAFLSQGDDFERQAQAFRRKLTRPAMSGVKITFDNDTVYDIEPAQLPNLYHGQPVRLYARYRRGGPAKVTVHGEVLGSPVEQTVSIALTDRNDANPEIERMWAFRRVTRLMDEDRSNGSNVSRDEIVRLCEGYSIASEYASFIVLENDAEYQRWKIERRNASRIARDRQAQQAVRNELTQLRDRAQAKLAPQAPTAKGPELAVAPIDSSTATEIASTKSISTAVPMTTAPAPVATPQSPVSTPTDLNFNPPTQDSVQRTIDIVGGGGGGGGGAIDPITALVAAGLTAAGYAAKRRAKRTASEVRRAD